ncbi:spore coat associated protein CotJA [Paenibacillus aurantius]|uniref:Spore coat associated protein CotJA n=1 Tax=Paenibacillus aurantius TaxID=2918900 RepID=A0AA96LEZ6_9BACL|nr:spore coat associated protein CotJA [Paenibacillus aurantius]WNQ12834.1 spore coat associated protein CotJA [Paenibacillus aurantius]
MSTDRKTFKPFLSKQDPCPPLKEKVYETPPNLYLGFQPPGLEQYKPEDALDKGTLWPALFGPYSNPFTKSKTKES